jgi:hypothetical protein
MAGNVIYTFLFFRKTLKFFEQMATNSFSTLTSLDGLGGVIKVKVLEFQSSHLNGILGINEKDRDTLACF